MAGLQLNNCTVASIVEYETVVDRMQKLGMRCQYYNSGAFGFDAAATHFTGWIGPPDSTIRPAALERATSVAEPHAQTLARLATRAWQELFPGPTWIMPKSHWAYELDFGSKAWLPAALQKAGVDPTVLESRTNAPAIEFPPNEPTQFEALVQSILENLLGSDFSLAFPDHPIIATLHHHKQVWWVSGEPALIESVGALT
jgi:hypothetical protein